MNMKKVTDQAWSLSICLLAAYAVMLVPVDAFATGPQRITSTICEVVNWFIGPVGTAIATLAIIIIGVGALMGKVSWGMAIIVGLGVAVIFGAPQIATLLGADAGAAGGTVTCDSAAT